MELNKAVLDCMQSLRRRLREELSVDIRLSQPDAVETMLLACLPAAIIPFWLGQLPIYDALRLRLLAARSPVATGVDK